MFAVVDFDGGGRLPVELTDVGRTDVAIGGRVEMTFRRLFTADGIHNYFWKAVVHVGTESHGIKDRVAIVGMGCTTFGEHWDRSADDLMVAAATRRLRQRRASRRRTSTPSGSAPRRRA